MTYVYSLSAVALDLVGTYRTTYLMYLDVNLSGSTDIHSSRGTKKIDRPKKKNTSKPTGLLEATLAVHAPRGGLPSPSLTFRVPSARPTAAAI